MAGTRFWRAEFQLSQRASVGCGDEESIFRHLSRRCRQKIVCAELCAVSRRQSARHGTGACPRQHVGQERKAGRVVLVHHQRKVGVRHALVGESTATATLADRHLLAVSRQHQDRSEVSVLRRKSFTTLRLRSGQYPTQRTQSFGFLSTLFSDLGAAAANS